MAFSTSFAAIDSVLIALDQSKTATQNTAFTFSCLPLPILFSGTQIFNGDTTPQGCDMGYTFSTTPNK